MRRLRCGDEQNLLEREAFGGGARDRQVPEVHGIEGAAEDSYVHEEVLRAALRAAFFSLTLNSFTASANARISGCGRPLRFDVNCGWNSVAMKKTWSASSTPRSSPFAPTEFAVSPASAKRGRNSALGS